MTHAFLLTLELVPFDSPGKKGDIIGILFTSPRSVEASFEALQGKDVHQSWQEAYNYTVGRTTCDLVSKKLNIQCSGEDSGNAEVLSDFILKDLAEKSITKGTFLFPCGNLKLGILEKRLQEGGFIVQPIEIYETVCNPALGEEIDTKFSNEAQYLLFYSPSCVNFTLPLLKDRGYDLQKYKFLAIGPSTKKAIEEEGIEVFKTCEKPSFEHVLKVLK
uniref:Uroporphyrinogen-III synthase n=1 Tax=Phlebotomus papatasi TaxID=29031 RepID=A0A1B0D576_PHLPP